jgi:hypothetical protein
MDELPEDWARKKTGDMLRTILSDTDRDSNDSGLDESVTGRLCSDKLNVNGYGLFLPPGNWASLARLTIKTSTANGLAYFLGKIEFKRLTGAIQIVAMHSTSSPSTGFRRFNGGDADNPNCFHTHNEGCSDHGSQALWLLSNFYTPPWLRWGNRALKFPDLDRAAARDMAEKGITYPQDLISVRFARAETWGLLDTNYLFSPERNDITSNTVLSHAESDWHPTRVAHYPEKLEYYECLKEWAETTWPRFKRGFLEGAPN